MPAKKIFYCYFRPLPWEYFHGRAIYEFIGIKWCKKYLQKYFITKLGIIIITTSLSSFPYSIFLEQPSDHRNHLLLS